MTAKELIDEYAELYGKGYQKRIDIDQYDHLRKWLEQRLNKKMPRPLYITQGSGGGQHYRLLWLVYDVLGNANKPVYYYTEMSRTDKYLRQNGHHLSLQQWVDDQNPHLTCLKDTQ